MSTMSMSGRATTSRQSVDHSSQPQFSASARVPSGSVPTTTLSTGRMPMSKKWGVFSQALLWALPMNLVPMMATFNVFTIVIVPSYQ